MDRQAYELSVLLPRPRQCVHAAQVDPHVVRDHLQRERGFLGLDEFRYRLRRCLHGLCPFDWERRTRRSSLRRFTPKLSFVVMRHENL